MPGAQCLALGAGQGDFRPAVVSRSDNQTIDCTFEGVEVEPGEYTFVVQTRSGLGDDFGVATATRLVKVVG